MATRRHFMVRYQTYMFMFISLCRVNADYQGLNIAIGKDIEGTPVEEDSLSHAALVDGDVQTCITSNRVTNPLIAINLHNDYKVGSISLIYPESGRMTNYNNMNVTLNKDEQTENCFELNRTSAPSNTWNLTFQCGDHEGQRITVVKLSSGGHNRGFGLCEFQVFGESSSPLGTSTTLHPEDNESSITSPTVSYSTSVAQSTTDNSHTTTDSSSTLPAQSTTYNSHTTSVNGLPRADDSCILNATRSRRGTLLRLNYGSRVSFVCPKGTEIVDASISICDHGNRMIPHRRCADIDECETDEHCCNFNFKCHNTIGSYLCLCSDGYREEGGLCVPERTLSERDGTENKIGENGNDVGSNYCLESEDGLWERTPSNHFSSWIPCSSDRQGVMRRFCNVKGEWNDPDTTECKTRELLDLAEKVTKIRDISDAVAIIESVAHYWKSNSAISAGDVVLISEILAKLAEIVASFNESNLNDTEIYIKLFSGEVCRLLTKDREPVWKEIHEKLALDKGVVTLFNALDSIGTTIYDFMIRSGKEVAYSCSVLDINGIFFKEDDNLVFGSSKRDCSTSTRQRRVVQRNSTAIGNSYVYFSKNTLDKLREASLEDKPLAVVSYIYNNPGDIIPADAQSTRSQGQEWVTSITAVNRIKKVNTPVISVSVFPKPEDSMNLDIQTRFFEKEEGYSPVCSVMKSEAKHGMWSTSGCKVTNSGKLDTFDYVECACGHLGSFAVIATMGKSPKPFLEAAAVPILKLCCSLSLFFIVISLFAVFMARLTSDFYVVLAQTILSFSFFPILVAMDALLDNQDYENSNRLVMAFSHTVMLSNSFWMMNLSVQFFIRLKYYLYRSTPARVLYVFCGWVIPCVVLACLIWMLPANKEPNSRPDVDASAILSSIDVIALLISAVTVLVYCRDYRMLAELVKLIRGPEEEILSAKMKSAIVLHSIFIVTRIVKCAVHMIENPVNSIYVFACCVFMEGSVIYLGFFATNKELLIVLRARYFEKDEEHKQAVQDFEDEDCQRLQIQKEIMEKKKKNRESQNPKRRLRENAEVRSRRSRLQYRNNDENDEVNMRSETIVLEEI
ncbi:adhesion G protein-coupled receptor E5-like [Ptychodera flava]|uniref:adhesion G protein-coupled receptor E5-like n=1 Tax=Ptychodera flava TaxID=63121 RepID=UPI00396A7C6D